MDIESLTYPIRALAAGEPLAEIRMESDTGKNFCFMYTDDHSRAMFLEENPQYSDDSFIPIPDKTSLVNTLRRLRLENFTYIRWNPAPLQEVDDDTIHDLLRSLGES